MVSNCKVSWGTYKRLPSSPLQATGIGIRRRAGNAGRHILPGRGVAAAGGLIVILLTLLLLSKIYYDAAINYINLLLCSYYYLY